MSDTPLKNLPAVPKKRPGHGLYSWVSSKKLPQGRAFQAIRRELTEERARFEAEHVDAKGNISPGARLLISSTIEAAGVVGLLGLYLRKYGVLDSRAAKRGSLELSPLLSRSWLSYQETIRRNVMALEELKRNRPSDEGVIRADFLIQQRDDEPDEQDQPVDEPPEAPGTPVTASRDSAQAQTTRAETNVLACSEKAANSDSYKPAPTPPAPSAPKPAPMDRPRPPELDHIRQFCGRKGCGSRVVVELAEVLQDLRANLYIHCPECGEAERFALSAEGFVAWQAQEQEKANAKR